MGLDLAVNLFMQRIQNPIFTTISIFLDFLFDPVILILVSFVVSIFLYVYRRKKESVVFFCSVAAAGIIIEALKFIFVRSRPPNPIIIATGYSFPSGHVIATLVFFGLLACILFRKKSQKIKLTSYFIAGILIFAVGFSRIYLRVHWLTDVLAGFVVGGIILIVSIRILRKKK